MKFNLFKRRSALFIIIGISIIALHFLKILIPVENLIIKISSPLQSPLYSAGTFMYRLNPFVKNNENLEQKNKGLKEENQKLLIENLALKTRIDQMKILEEQTKYLESRNLNFLTARVISKDIFHQYDFLTVNKGKKDGIVINLPVVVNQGIMIGKVIEVDEQSAKIILLTNPHNQTAATFEDKNKTIGVVSGDYGLSMKMDLIPQEEIIEINEKIITSGLEEFIPKGLIIGEVTRIEKEEHGFFQIAYLRSLISYNNIYFVSILKTNEL